MKLKGVLVCYFMVLFIRVVFQKLLQYFSGWIIENGKSLVHGTCVGYKPIESLRGFESEL